MRRLDDTGKLYALKGARTVWREPVGKRSNNITFAGWLPYIESHFNIARKMVDAKFARATSWGEALAIHRRFMRDYNVQRVRHFGACKIPFTERRG